MNYKIFFDINAKKVIKKIEKGERRKITDRIKKLEANPRLGKRLSGNLFGLWKLRVDKFRIFYKIIEENLIIVIVEIGHRKNIY